MEEKERYKDCYIAYNSADENGVEDTLTGKQMDIYDIVDLLNQQNKEIHQLKQLQKQLAISELKALAKFCEENAYYYEEEQFSEKINKYINEKIEKLKGE